jgi:hypothetical protein
LDAVRTPVDVLPLVGSAPVQFPVAVQEVAFVELQTRVAALPLVRLVGFARSVTAGAGVAGEVPVTETDVVASLLPPAPLQVSVKLAVAVKVPVGRLPLVATVPLQPPEAAHDVALVELQLRVELPPALMLAGEALRDTVGVGVALEPPPPQPASATDTPITKPAATLLTKRCERPVTACTEVSRSSCGAVSFMNDSFLE